MILTKRQINHGVFGVVVVGGVLLFASALIGGLNTTSMFAILMATVLSMVL